MTRTPSDLAISAPPTLATARLRLRPHRLADLPERVAMTADLATMRHIGGAAQDAEENHARILRYAGHWALCGFGAFALEEQASGRFAGEAGIATFQRGLGPDFDGWPEALWVMAAWAEGRGYAGEAMTAALDWYEARFGPSRIVCIIAPDNAPSLRLAAKLGFRPYREALYHDRPVLLHAREPLVSNRPHPS